MSNMITFGQFSANAFVKSNSFWKRRSLMASGGQTAKAKMIAYWSSNSEVVTVFFSMLMYVYIKSLTRLSKNPLSMLSHTILVPKHSAFFPHIFVHTSVLRDGAPAGTFLFSKDDTSKKRTTHCFSICLHDCYPLVLICTHFLHFL